MILTSFSSMNVLGSDNEALQPRLEEEKKGGSVVVTDSATTTNHEEELTQLRDQVQAADAWMAKAGEKMTGLDGENTTLQQQLERANPRSGASQRQMDDHGWRKDERHGK